MDILRSKFSELVGPVDLGFQRVDIVTILCKKAQYGEASLNHPVDMQPNLFFLNRKDLEELSTHFMRVLGS